MQTVFQKGLAHVPAQWRQDSPTDIPAILGSWITELGELMEMRGVVRGLLCALASRAGLKPNQQPPVSRLLAWSYVHASHAGLLAAAGLSAQSPCCLPCWGASGIELFTPQFIAAPLPAPALLQTVREIVPLVGQLVDFERAALHSREVISAAEAVLASQPGLLVNRIVSHFLELFGCKLEGALPCMNKVGRADARRERCCACSAGSRTEPVRSTQQGTPCRHSSMRGSFSESAGILTCC